jgi:hypothetical protein
MATLNVVFVLIQLLFITHKPAPYLKRYTTVTVLSRCMKIGCHLALQLLLLSKEVTVASPNIFRDAFVTSLGDLLLVAPVADPLHWGSNLAAQLMTLGVINSRNGMICAAAFSSESRCMALAHVVPVAPSLQPMFGFPSKAQTCIAQDCSPGCEALLRQIQLVCCFAGCVISVAAEVYFRRAFLLANASRFGEGGAGKAKAWPLGDLRGWGICAALVVGYAQGFLLLYEVLVWT